MMTRTIKIAGVAAFLFVFFLPFHVLAENKILNIRYWAAPDHTRVVIDTSDDIPYTVEKAERKVLIYFKDAKFAKALPHKILLKKPGIDKILVTSPPEDGVKVELSIAAQVETNVFKLNKIEDKPDRVVIDIEFPEVEKQETQEREQVKVSRKNKIIVIDPGHGGEDPGAVGRYRTYEKRVVLEISKKLRSVINKKEGYRAYLTRDGDYYVPFKKRLKIAREYGADLFISVHADAFRSRGASGSSVYCLSLRGASSEAAKLMARKENLADIVGGSPNGESGEESDPIILNMFQTNTINTSKVFGTTVLKHLDRVGHVKFSRVQEAPFRVLKLPEIPSVLIETAYISNPKEERLLKTNRYQMKVAKAIATSVTEFLPLRPLPKLHTVVAKKQIKEESNAAVKELEEKKKSGSDADEREETSSVVKREEDEKETAGNVEKEEKTISPVIKKEGKKKKRYVAKELVTEPKQRIILYKAGRGDTLEKIAIRHGTTIGALLKLNNMKLKEPLHVGRILKISKPAEESDGVSEKVKHERASTEPKAKPGSSESTSVYRVKKGDTLDKIAKKHNTTVSLLLKLNHMKLKEPLHAGRILTISKPAEDSDDISEKIKHERAPTEGKGRLGLRQSTSVYRVKKGDTLDKIAKKHNTTVSSLLKLNHMKLKESLYVGKKLKIMDTETGAKEQKKISSPSGTIIYKVKKGDTLERIAQKYNTSIPELRRLNRMKPSDVLYFDQKLKLPKNRT